MMSLAFYHPDGAPGGIDMKLPRKEALLRVLTQMGMPQDTTAKLIRQAEQNARSWFASVVEMMNQ